MIATQIAHYTPTEYLEREDISTIKHELIDGEIIPVAGASANHNRLNLNFCRLFPLEINGQDYEIFMNDMRLWLPVNQSYVYPDAIVISATPQFTDSKQTAVTNPCLIMEVLSTSTEGYDKSGKFRLYRSIPSFEEYLLIDQFSYRVEQYTKVDSHQWLLTEWLGEDAVMQLQSASVQIPLKDLYHRVSFNVSISGVGE
ncbi:Uma2 family endonuclease [Chamaesiphon sp. VAR_48_metabat_403]|uniref:Uma2 family endonuclease n=1 Tax=Chamaesiphon sp. VAR_48_metabat_403 TaxID=2964700 RepID=UPI00286DD1DC|nr:Uma2 family endonuclease [Chamaesiphon sp. VAR_48_metabat_403]